MNNIKPKQHYVAYFDVLGYKSFFSEDENDFQDMFNGILGISRYTKLISEEKIVLKRKMFSDNCIILLEEGLYSEMESLMILSKLVAIMQIKILKDYRLPIRGGITKGLAYADDDIVFGQGVINVVNIEESKAIYPRVVIDKNIFNQDSLNSIDWLRSDSDGEYYINFFSLLTVSDIFFPPSNVKKDICDIRNQVYYLVNKYGRYDRRKKNNNEYYKSQERIISKYLWLLIKYNEFIKERHLPCNIEYDISVCELNYKFEITNLKKNPWPIVGN